jgi:hypothetical protein
MLLAKSKNSLQQPRDSSIRYDTSHGFAHKDILHFTGEEDKQPLYFQDFKMAFTFAIQDLKTSWIWYRMAYEREIENEESPGG